MADSGGLSDVQKLHRKGLKKGSVASACLDKVNAFISAEQHSEEICKR